MTPGQTDKLHQLDPTNLALQLLYFTQGSYVLMALVLLIFISLKFAFDPEGNNNFSNRLI